MASKRVLVDYHHPDLYYSLVRLFGYRLGYEVFRPIGMDWYHTDTWQFEPWHEEKATLFLYKQDDDTPARGRYGKEWARIDPRHDRHMFRMVEYYDALEQDWAYVVATVPDNLQGFKVFADRVGARLVQQVGNNEHRIPDLGQLLMMSTNRRIPDGMRGVYYEQELDAVLTRHFAVDPYAPVGSFILDWHKGDISWRLFNHVKSQVDRPFLTYGSRGTDLPTVRDVASEMVKCSAIWHTKDIGDGWGHVIHSACALGRGLIGKSEFYLGMVGERLWTPDNALDLSGMDFNQAFDAVHDLLAHPARLVQMGMSSREIVEDLGILDYDAQARKVLELIDG